VKIPKCLSLLVLPFMVGCSSNPCQNLCDVYYRMQSRCQIFGQDPAIVPVRCDQGHDSQTVLQSAQYNILQCRQDFQDPSEAELSACCQQICYESLVDAYDAVNGVRESDYEKRRDLCAQYRQLVSDGQAPWCATLKAGCR